MWMALLIPLFPYLVKRVFISLGIGLITYTFSTALFDYFVSSIQGQYSSLTGDVAMIVGLYGLPDATGVILGAYSTSLSLTAIKKFGFL